MGLLSRDLLHNPNIDGVHIPEGASYIGAFTAATLPFLVFWRKRRDVLFFAALAFLCLEIAYGWQPGFWVSQHIPVLSGLPNWRLLSVADFAFAILAGFAISALEARCDKPRQFHLAPVAWLLAGAAAGALIVLRIAGITQVALRFNLILVLLSLTIAMLAAFCRIHSSDFLRTAAIVVVADLTTAGFAFVPFVKPADIFPSAAVFDFLLPKANPLWRVSGVDTVYGAQYELPYGLSTATGYDVPGPSHGEVPVRVQDRGPFPIGRYPGRAQGNTRPHRHPLLHHHRLERRYPAFRRPVEPLPPDLLRRAYPGFREPRRRAAALLPPATAAQVADNDDAQFQAITRADFDGRRTLVIPQKIDRFWGQPRQRSVSVASRESLGR